MLETDEGSRDCVPPVWYGHYPSDHWQNHSAKALGGTSAILSGWIVTRRDIDFDNPAVGTRWPIGRADLVSYYRDTASMLERDPSIVDFERPIFDPWVLRALSPAPAIRFGLKYRDLLSTSTLIDVAMNCTVVALEANDSRSLLTRLWYFHHDTATRRPVSIRQGQAVVVACGIGNAQLLLQPPSDGGVPVGNEGGAVGQYLMEHPHLASAATCVMDVNLDEFGPLEAFGWALPTVMLAEDRMRDEGLYACSMDFSLDDNEEPEMRDYLDPASSPVASRLQDARLALRLLARDRGFTALAARVLS